MAKLTSGTRSDVQPEIKKPVFIKEPRSVLQIQRRARLEIERFKPKNIKTVTDVISLNTKKGMFFFSPDTLKFFNSRVLGGELQGKNKDLFITSEKQPSIRGQEFSRRFTIRRVNKTSGDISTAGEFQGFGSQSSAKESIIKNKL